MQLEEHKQQYQIWLKQFDIKLKQLTPTKNILHYTWFNSPLGAMLIIADNHYLYLLEFIERRQLKTEITRLQQRLNCPIVPGKTKITVHISNELTNYFSASCTLFKTPIYLIGSKFQTSVWHQLQTIPIGQTCSYQTIASAIGNDKAYRAVASANGSNQLAIIIPCHRVIYANGKLGGYAGGIKKKAWLLNHEKTMRNNLPQSIESIKQTEQIQL